VALSLMVGSDERLLDDIEKLIKRKLPVERLEVGPVEERPRRERREPSGERREPAAERREPGAGRREPAGEAAAPRRRRPEGESRGPRAMAYSSDPFFYKPYEPQAAEPAEATAEVAAEAPARASASGARKSSRPVAALLGGGSRKS
jgi:hypothetical protein